MTNQTDRNSQNRIDELNQLLRFYFGNNWTYLFLFLAIFMSIIFFVISSNISEDQYVELSPFRAKLFTSMIIFGFMMLTMILAILLTKNYYSSQEDEEGSFIPNYIPGQVVAKKVNQAVEVIVLVFVIMGLSLIFLNMIRKKPENNSTNI